MTACAATWRRNYEKGREAAKQRWLTMNGQYWNVKRLRNCFYYCLWLWKQNGRRETGEWRKRWMGVCIILKFAAFSLLYLIVGDISCYGITNCAKDAKSPLWIIGFEHWNRQVNNAIHSSDAHHDNILTKTLNLWVMNEPSSQSNIWKQFVLIATKIIPTYVIKFWISTVWILQSMQHWVKPWFLSLTCLTRALNSQNIILQNHGKNVPTQAFAT